MQKHFLSLLALLFCATFAWAASVTPAAQIPSYYANIDNTSAGGLWNAVHTDAKKGYSSLSYKGLWSAYATTDVYPGTTKIWDMYSNCTFTYSADQCGSYSGECDCYNREHSIPKSWFGGSEGTSTPGSDLFHIVPTDGYVNNQRSNWPFGEVSSATYTRDGSKLGTSKAVSVSKTMLGEGSVSKSCTVTVFEPQNQYKGDFARMYMGAMIRWAGDYQSFASDKGKHMFSGTYTAAGNWGLTEYGLALLMKWHRQDPVSQKEIDRNNAVQGKQGNRNPFIDYPYLAEYIWGEKAGQTVQLAQLMPSCDAEFVPGQSDGWRGGEQAVEDIESQQTARKVLIDGQLYILVNDEMFTITGQRVK